MNPNFNRRQFIGLAVCVAVNTALPGCKKKEPEWTAAKDDKLKPLAFEISEGKATPLSGSGWKRCDDYIHLQLSGSSIPDRKIAKVKQKKAMQTAPAVWIADLNRQYIDMKKGRSTSPLFRLLHKFRSISKQ